MAISAKVMEQTLRLLREDEASLNRKLADYQTTLNQREAVRQAIAGLENVLERVRGVPDSEDLPLWKGAQQILQERGQPLSAVEITRALQALGFRIAGKTPVESVRTSLIRKLEMFQRRSDGKFDLTAIGRQETR